MEGWVEFFRVGSRFSSIYRSTHPPTLERVRQLVGGHIEVVPHWTFVDHEGRRYQAVALCNEEGKLENLPLNVSATIRWARAIGMPVADLARVDVLAGNVVLLFGDEEFLADWT